ncbi:hypothetical protein VTK56DRAFT_6472 [Thermocarpiscus australiensis]
MPCEGGKHVDNLHQQIDKQVAALVSLLETKYLSTKTSFKPVDLARKGQYFTLDVISALAFGKELGYLVADADLHDYIRTTESETVVQIIAGSDTSATAIRSTLSSSSVTNPRFYRAACWPRKIDAGVRARRICSPLTDAEAPGLPFLQARHPREGLRMYPPATALLPKLCRTRTRLSCAACASPRATNVAWAPFNSLRSREAFGDDADVFRPERWLDLCPPARYRTMDRAVMMEFASGSRWECLGKTVAERLSHVQETLWDGLNSASNIA